MCFALFACKDRVVTTEKNVEYVTLFNRCRCIHFAKVFLSGIVENTVVVCRRYQTLVIIFGDTFHKQEHFHRLKNNEPNFEILHEIIFIVEDIDEYVGLFIFV